MAGRRVDEYDEREYYRGPPRGTPVQLAERAAPVRSRDLEDLWRRPAEERERQVAFLQDDYDRVDDQPLVLRERKVETFKRPTRHSPPRPRSPSPEIYRRERYVERERERSPSPLYDRERIRSPSPIHERERTSVRIVERDRERRRSPSSSPEPRPRMPLEPPIIRAPPIHQEIITHHRHIDHGYGYQPAAALAPPPRLQIPRSRVESRETDIDIHTGHGETDVEIHKSRSSKLRDDRARDFYDDDVIYERDRERDRLKARTDIRRSVSSARDPRDRIRPYESEAEYYARKTDERAYIGEAYKGATKKWEIVDVPPGTERVRMDGVGGGSQEVTWQKYNGVRRSKFIPERDSMGSYDREREREKGWEKERERDTLEISINDRRVSRPLPQPRNRFGDLWTEITKDLVVREAIEQLGYDYEETEYFFYVFRYLKYDDVVELVDISDDIRKARRGRIREMTWEREHPRPRERSLLKIEASRSHAEPLYDDERIIEREIVYDPPRRSTRVYY